MSTVEQLERRRAKDRRWYANNLERCRAKDRKYYANNRDKKKESFRNWYVKNRVKNIKDVTMYQAANPDVVKRCNANYYRKNSEKLKAYQVTYSEANREKINIRIRKHSEANREEINASKRAYVKQRIKTNLQFRISHVMRSRLSAAIKGKKPVQKTIDLVGLSFSELILHIQGQFQLGMSWENYGFRGWHIDHIKPIASFNLIDPDEQRRCFHYTNLQPLWWKDNLRKKRKL